MELADYLRLLRRRWYLLVLALLLGAAGSIAATHQEAKVYEASTTFFVAQPNGQPVNSLIEQTIAARISTYVTLAQSGPVLHRAVAAMPANTGTGGLSVAARPLPGLIFMGLETRANSPQGAYQLAVAYTKVLPPYIAHFEGSTRGGDATTLKVLEQPSVSSKAVSPNPTHNLLIGLGIGFAVGLCALFIAEALDSRLRTADAVERITKLPVLATVPGEYRGEPLVAATKPRSHRAEAIRQLRTNIQFATVDRALRSVVVTSSVPDEGKSSVAVNLAITFAAIGKRVVLVDADLRKPSVAEFMSLEGEVGLTSVLIGQATLDEALVPWGREGNLLVLPAGPRPANPSELLASAKMAEVFEALKMRGDVVVIDTPPLLPVTDAAVLGARSDGIILVARLRSTPRNRLSAAVSQLRKLELPVLGVVANFAERADGYTYYGYGPARGLRKRRRKEELIDAVPASPSSATPLATDGEGRPRRASRRAEKHAHRAAASGKDGELYPFAPLNEPLEAPHSSAATAAAAPDNPAPRELQD